MLTRRRFGAAVAALFAGAACGGGRPPAAGRLRFGNRPFFVDGATLPAFERSSGVVVEYHEDAAVDAAVVDALRHERDIGRDALVLGEQPAAALAASRLLQAFLDQPPSRLRPALARPGPVRQVPWAAAVTGLVVAAARVPRPVVAAADLLSPALADHVAFVRSGTETVAMVLRASGIAVDAATAADVDAAIDAIDAARRAGAAVVDTVYDARLGDADGPWIAVGSDADAMQLRAEGTSVAFVLPEEGGVVWSDDVVMPKAGRNRAAVAALVSFVYRPDVSRRLFSAFPFTSPVEGVGSLPDGVARLRDLTRAEQSAVARALA